MGISIYKNSYIYIYIWEKASCRTVHCNSDVMGRSWNIDRI